MVGLTKPEIIKVVNRYIGVSGGYLGDFSYRTHAEFYLEYCNLDHIDPNLSEGTTKERFLEILSVSPPRIQAKILRGVLERFQISAPSAPTTRTNLLKDEIIQIIARLEAISPVENPSLEITSAVIERAIADSEHLLRTNGATSGVDRIHTALHGYLIIICDKAGIVYPREASLTALFKLIRHNHPKLKDIDSHRNEIGKILNSSSAILDALNTLRNNASIAHPNQSLLEEEEAMLVINITRSLLHYLNEKLRE
jgi:hypothetical protein